MPKPSKNDTLLVTVYHAKAVRSVYYEGFPQTATEFFADGDGVIPGGFDRVEIWTTDGKATGPMRALFSLPVIGLAGGRQSSLTIRRRTAEAPPQVEIRFWVPNLLRKSTAPGEFVLEVLVRATLAMNASSLAIDVGSGAAMTRFHTAAKSNFTPYVYRLTPTTENRVTLLGGDEPIEAVLEQDKADPKRSAWFLERSLKVKSWNDFCAAGMTPRPFREMQKAVVPPDYLHLLYLPREEPELNPGNDDKLVVRLKQPISIGVIGEGLPREDWAITTTVESADLVHWWNESVARPLHGSLRRVESGAEFSLLPIFEELVPEDPLTLRWSFTWSLDYGRELVGAQLGDPTGSPRTSPSRRVEFRGLRMHRGTVFQVKARLQIRLQMRTGQKKAAFAKTDQTSTWLGDPTLRFQLIDVQVVGLATENRQVRFGSVDLAFTGGMVARPDTNFFLVRPREGLPPAVVRSQLELLASSIQAVTEDAAPVSVQRDPMLPPQRRELPIAVQLEVARSASLALTVEEWVGLEEPHGLRIKLATQPGAGAKPSFAPLVLIKPRPFLLARVEPPRLHIDLRGELSGEFGIYVASGEEPPAWRFAVQPMEGAVNLPPQGLGEAMEKYQSPKPEGQVDGCVATEGTPKEGAERLPNDIGPGELVDFRFTPNAQIEVATNYFEGRFHEALWNFDRVFGYAGQRDPGAFLNRAVFEMLYGLACEVRSPAVKLVESASRLGALVQPDLLTLPWDREGATGTLEQRDSIFQYWREWLRRQEGSVLSRLGLLEMIDVRDETRAKVAAREILFGGKDEPGKIPRGFLLKDGLRFYLRDLPERTEGAAFPEDGRPRLRYPVQVKGKARRDSLATYHRHDEKQGLAGGVGWGFFDAEGYEAFRAEPGSSSGEISDIAFSSMGGWGGQKARFNNDRVIVDARCTMGRLQHYELQFIGRIGVLYHKAKLVVLFERTTAPTEQFQDKQDCHLGRPLLRKVREYVQFIQPERAYPDFAGGKATDTGPLRSAKFPEIIPIDTDWKEDVFRGHGANRRKVGWKVPLWKTDPRALGITGENALKRFRKVYPKPAVIVTASVEAAAEDTPPEERINSHELDNPEDLYFYHEFAATDDQGRPLTAQTDLWPPVFGVDWDVVPDRENIVADHPPGLEGPQPEPPSVPAGLRAYTFVLAPGRRKTNLMEGRSGESMAAKLRNVTMMRSQARAEDPGQRETQRMLALPSEIAGLSAAGLTGTLRKLQTAAGLPSPETLRNWVREDLGGLQKKLNSASNWLKGAGDFWSREVTGPAERALHELCDDPEHSVRAILERQLFAPAEALVREAGAEKERWVQRLNLFIDSLETAWPHPEERVKLFFEGAFSQGEAMVDGQARAISSQIDALARRARELGQSEQEIRKQLVVGLEATESYIRQVAATPPVPTLPALAEVLAEAGRRVKALRDQLAGGLALAEFVRKAEALANEMQGLVKGGRDDVLGRINGFRKDLASAFKLFDALRVDAIARLKKIREQVEKAEGNLDALQDALLEEIRKARAARDELLKTACGEARNKLDELKRALRDLPLIPSAKAKLDEYLKLGEAEASRIEAELRAALASNPTVAKVKEQIERLQDTIRDDIVPMAEELVGEVREAVGKVEKFAPAVAAGVGLARAADEKLRALRAFCEAPEVFPLKFNRKSVAFFFTEGKKALDMTPVVARFKGLQNQLDALGLRIPTQGVLDGFTPDALKGMSLSRIFSNVGGMDFGKLFPGVTLPAGLEDKVQVSHGFDREKLSAWAKAQVNAPLPGQHCLFSFGPLAVYLTSARLNGRFQFTADIEGKTDKIEEGEVVGSWEVRVGGSSLVTFADTTLRYDRGKLHFNLNPAKVQLSQVLRFISDLMARFSSDSGLSLGLIMEGMIPVGAKAALNLPIPPVASGTFSITGLKVNAYFALRALDRKLQVDFSLGTGFSLGRPDAPFNLSVFVLGGGGWLVVDALYAPFTGRLEAHVNFGVMASATLAISLGGVVEGVLSVFLGVTAEFHTVSGQPAAFAVGVQVLFRGDVSVLGIINIMLSLLLQAKYLQGGGSKTLIGTGTLTLRIKICWCFTLKISKSITHKLGDAPAGGAALEAPGSPFRLAALDLPDDSLDLDTLLAEADAEVWRTNCLLA